MDFVFGNLVNDELKLSSHRAERRGIQHQHVMTPADPQPHDTVTITVVTDSLLEIDQVALYYTTDGSDPAGSRGAVSNGTAIAFKRIDSTWDTLLWDYLVRWQAVIPGQPDGTMVRYVISGWANAEGTDETYADFPVSKEIVEHTAMVYFNHITPIPDYRPGDPTKGHIFAYHVDRLTPPDWARDAIIYHIFVDRFYPGHGKTWLQTTDLEGFCGGTLWGVLEKLDYIEALGANVIWLSPTWVAPSHHGYDTTDYDHVEPRLGGDEALHALVEAAHARGIRVLLDLVCNHISDQHPIFQEALHNPDSPCRDWFTFTDTSLGYKAFFNVPSQPELNLANPAARDWMIEIATRWLREYDIDGYRLDYAQGPGPDFWSYFRVACKQVKPDCIMFGELIEVPSKVLQYQGRLDGCLDFQVSDALRRTFGWKSWSGAQFNAFIRHHYAFFTDGFFMPTFLDNHDMDRFSFIVGNDPVPLKQAAEIQMSLPGAPIIYYGTEVGVKQRKSTREFGLHLSREPMVWDDEQDADLLAFYQRIIAERKTRR
jgi:cyclomaltodextrinase